MPNFNNTIELEKYINKCISIALRNTADILTKKLVDYIDEDFYSLYNPRVYIRSYQLQDSPKFQMLSNAIAEVFVDTDSMNYEDATGDYVAKLAARGFHGNKYIFREGYYWEDFLKYCHENARNIYMLELRKLGLNAS